MTETTRPTPELHEFDPNYGACRVCAIKDGTRHAGYDVVLTPRPLPPEGSKP